MTNKQLPDITAELLAPSEVAKMLHVATRTVTRMGDRGDLPMIKLPSGHRRYRRAAVEALIRGERAA